MFSLPKWIEPHLFTGKKFSDLTAAELADLQNRISKFRHEQPDVSVMIPAWNEENNIFRTLSSLSANETNYKVEIVVINNNSKDNTQAVLDQLGVRSYLQPEQGTPHARQMGLEKARGKYHLCADSDTFYPPKWIDLMVKPMVDNAEIVGVYGRYCFIPPEGQGRFGLWLYELMTGVLVQIRKRKREFLNTLGFNMGFVTQVGRDTGGFKVKQVRKFDNAAGSDYFVDEAEDGTMAVNLKKQGRLKLVLDHKARVFTSPRRLMYDGGVWAAFKNRFKGHGSGMGEYITGKSKNSKQ
ncbi:glycosyl transferase family 2 [Mucilaginibacter sp. PPCGB 2223]|uniref:glycosyltransferase family 2 protein n=1 Tax=Mucilaginibacter sp. PPCGB 2223 TaxID=1886027 RepID=UPI0008264135|nr:glycosyltransferase family A protein [Mucilaginibacter sp. PPCGB 2223]OCX51585.1 glycosyl transferase family 2 [Mucilaginibacter sp. PPCGB 2223]